MSELKNIDNIKHLILNNNPIDDKLHVIAVISNPCNYKIRYKLTLDFMEKMKKEPHVILYVVELVYGNQIFQVTESNNNKHLQIRTDSPPLWHKENMINLGVKYLLPTNWNAFAWIDADIEFDSAHWALDTLKVLNGGRDFVQLFSHCIDMDSDEQILYTFTSFGYQYTKNLKKGKNHNYWHSGFAWACNKKTYDKIGGIFEDCVLGSGDNIISSSFINNAQNCLKKGISQDYINLIINYQNKMKDVNLGYIPGTIRHFFHGKKENRNYCEREEILIKYQYNPSSFIKKNDLGLIIPSDNCPIGFLEEVANYFKIRNEDEIQKSCNDNNDTFKNKIEQMLYKIKRHK